MSLSAIFRDLLGVPVGIDDDFFARGGHSLLATRLVARIRAELHVLLPLRSVFETPTVRGLAAAVDDLAPRRSGFSRDPSLRNEVAAEAAPTGGVAPLSLVQQRLWFLDRLRPGNSAYHLAWAFELRGVLNQPALQAALDGLVVRHSSLRTHFRERDGVPEQVIGAATGWPLQRVACSEHLLAGVLTEATVAPFQLEAGPPVRALLVETAPDVHVLLLAIHHIVADGWSFGVLSQELACRYAAAKRGVSVALPALHRDYADYAREQRHALAHGELARQLRYWQQELRDAPPTLDLPTDRPRPELPSQRGARLARTLPAELQAALRTLAGQEGCTLFMVLLAGFDLLLARCTGTEDVLVGTPIAGRSQRDLEGLVGFFVNTLVLRLDLRGNPTVRELLSRVRAVSLRAYEHADVPFELLVETLRPPRNLGRTPLFQVLFNLHSEPGAPLELEGLEVRPMAVPRHTAKFELSVSLAETAAGLAVTVEYSTDLFAAASIERFVADYAVVLAAMVAAPEARLTELPFSPAESAAVAAVARRDEALTLPAAFALQVARTPHALAVSAPATGDCAAVDWSYAELATAANAIAVALLERGVAPGDRVGLWFGHGAGQVAAILGVLQAGGVYVPLDTQAPAARLRTIIRDAGVRVLVTDRSAPAWQLPGLELVACESLPAGVVTGPSVESEPDALAYLLCTSGTTGTPTAVTQTHRNVLHFVRAWAGNLGLAPEDRLSLLSTYGYDAAVQDIFGALLTGAAVCPLDVRHLDRTTLLDRVADRGLTVWHGTPTAYRYLFGGNVACRQDLTRLRLLVLGGEAARRADWELFCARFRRGARFVNGYGLTEATAVTQWFADHDTPVCGQQLPIGRPLLKLELCDATGARTPFAGEIVIESPHVARGQGRFHTGDLARYLPDGNLVFVGRRDLRLKIAGVRIEPGDVETAIQSHPAILEAVVMAPEERAGEPVLTAWYTLRPEHAGPTSRALRSHLGGLLPAALIPARFVPCEQLPRLPNGKLDRQVLIAAGAPSGATPLPLPTPRHSLRGGGGSRLKALRRGTLPCTPRCRTSGRPC